MGLYRYNGKDLVKADLWQLHRGLDVFFCCPGPSLAHVQAEDLKVPGAVVYAVNTAYPRIRPDVWVGMDSPACYDGRLWWDPCLKLAGSLYPNSVRGGRRICEAPNSWFITGREMRPWQMFDHLTSGSEFYWPAIECNTFMTGLHLAFYLGARRVFLLGCDFGGSADYHDGRQLSDAHRARNRRLYETIVRELPLLRGAAEERGFEIVSCTPDSPANEYLKFVPVSEAVALARGNCPPSADGVALDAEYANACEWKPCGEAGRAGVVVGSDSRTAYLFPWWLSNFQRTNPGTPVAVADFGMTPEQRRHVNRKHDVYTVRAPAGIKGWFRKPFALLQSPFEATAWLDLDTEVRGSVAPILQAAESGFAVAEDPYMPPVNTGVVGVRRGNALVSEWARRVIVDGAGFRGDQEVLAPLVASQMDKVTLLDPRLNWLRLRGDPPEDAVVIHWTGMIGKDRIHSRLGVPVNFRGTQLVDLLDEDVPLRGAEIGVLAGRLSAFLLRELPGLELLMVDRWAAIELPEDVAGISGTCSAERMESNYRLALQNTEFAAGRRTVLRGSSVDMAAQVPDESLDFVFVDANHTYAGCVSDIRAWLPKVKPGGLVAGHDIDHPEHPHWGVREAVEEAMMDLWLPMEALKTGSDYTWWFRKPESIPARGTVLAAEACA